MARQCIKPKRHRNSTWFKEKAMLAEALELGMVLDEEQMEFLADNRDTVTTDQQSQEIPPPAAFQRDDLDAFDSNCDEAPSTSVVLMAKLSSYDLEILSNVPNHDTYLDNQMIYQKTKTMVVQDTSSFTQQDELIMSVIEEMTNKVAKCNEHAALSVIDTEKTLKLAEKSRLKIHAKQNDLIVQEKKGNIAPIDYVLLNKLFEHFDKHFMPQKQLFAEQAFWLSISKPVSGFEHIQKAFDKDVKPFVKTLKEYFYMFDQDLHKEITDMKEVFTQMKTKVAKSSVERKTFEIKEKELLIENDHLLELVMSQDLVHNAVNSLAEIINYQSMEKSFLDEYSKCVELKAELSKKNEMVKKSVYDEPSKRCARMENRSQIQAKNNSITKLKDHIAILKGKGVSKGVKSETTSKVIALRMHNLDLEPLVKNIAQKDKNKAKRTKPSTGMERVRKTKAEGLKSSVCKLALLQNSLVNLPRILLLRVELFALEEVPVVTMADQRTMAELLCAPTEGYVEAIVVPPIPAEHFELKHSLINLVTSKQFFGFEKEDPHAHIRYFNKITSTLKYKDDLLRACLHHGFTEFHQLDTFYNGLNPSDQDSLNSAAGGNLLERSAQDVLKIIKNKSKVHNSRNKPIVSQVKASNVNSSKIASVVTSAMTAMFKQHQVTLAPAFVKAVEESCVTCDDAHSYRTVSCH
ncbi:hypothetical protein Tco_0703735 [Tanacetum coccineum]|uniref:Reverse transcriptase domain-containing protein n=1 Tax=Tanacetum coccineum TaxID=301880 RepID=A0ABQ4Y069_9ASTR